MKQIFEVPKKNYGEYPERVLQFGEGNFLRAFADWMIDDLNERGLYRGSIILCQPIRGGEPLRNILNEQKGDYTVILHGSEQGQPRRLERLVTSVSRCINAYEDLEELQRIFCSPDLEVIVSNTTEAGIRYRENDRMEDAPAESFPGKLTQLLYRRFKAFDGKGHGLLFLPVELIDNNGYELRKIILRYAREWELGEAFIRWIEEENYFTSTLVDRIVTGYPAGEAESLREELGYEDKAIVTCELFDLWVIEGSKSWSDILPLGRGEGNVIWTDDVKPYKMRKVRILNGGHTSTVLAGILTGHELVLDLMDDSVYAEFLDQILHEEVIPTIPLPEEELEAFASDVKERFRNPFIRHRLLDISMNSVSKFRARCLPSLLQYREQEGKLPERLCFSLAALLRFYQGTLTEEGMTGRTYSGTEYPVRDGREVLELFTRAWEHDAEDAVRMLLSDEGLWGKDLTEVPDLADKVAGYFERLRSEKPEEVIWKLNGSSE